MIKLESELSRGVKDYLKLKQNHGDLVFLRLNSGDYFLPAGNGKFYKVEGCPTGTADFVVVVCKEVTRGLYYFNERRVIFIELKTTTGKQSPEQKEFEVMVKKQNCEYHIIRSMDDLMRVV